MCSLYQLIGLWVLVALASGLSVVIGVAAGWHAHTVKYKRMQVQRDLTAARKVGGWAVTATMALTIVGFCVYAYLTSG